MPRTITDAHVEEVVVRTLEEVPEGATHRSKRELAKRVGISPTSVHRIWRAFGLQPWRTEDFKIYPDPLPIDKVRDVIGLYLAPSANAAVFAVDEKPPGSRSPPCAHHDPLCAMQTREWTSTRTIQNERISRDDRDQRLSPYVTALLEASDLIDYLCYRGRPGCFGCHARSSGSALRGLLVLRLLFGALAAWLDKMPCIRRLP